MKRRSKPDLHGADVDILQVLALQSSDPRRIRSVLDPRNPIAPTVLPHVIPLLGVRAVASSVIHALERVAEQRPGALIDALLDARLAPTVRRRLARVLSASPHQSVADGLLLAMSDRLLDVRIQSARALFRLRRRNPELRIDAERMFDLVREELSHGVPDLAHLFTLLAFVLPVEPLRAAYRGLKGDDQRARGTALEYLGGVLPRDVREGLWTILEGRGVNPR